MSMRKNRKFILVRRLDGICTPEDFALVEEELAELAEDDFLGESHFAALNPRCAAE